MIDRLASTSHVWVAAASVLMVVLLIVPVAPWVLDLLLSVNITLALVILLVCLYTENALSFSVFPTLLLVITLFRLSLNVTGTRSILLHGYAGQVIEAFGNIVVGGNYVVGLIVFAILIVIQFVVITNGAGRVAEVAARFTLDAMPGKQLAVDADLNAGLITEAEARQRRKDIQRAADFYGAMDGASKFVRGDAIAAVVIVFVNIIGGFVIGVIQDHSSIVATLQHYTLLTIGEGIVTQIPALLISTATGIIVTRAASEGSFGHDLSRQLVQEPRALAIAGRAADPVRLVRAAAAVHVHHGRAAVRALHPPAQHPAARPPLAAGKPGGMRRPARRARASPARPRSPRSSRPSRSCRCSRTTRWSWRSASA